MCQPQRGDARPLRWRRGYTIHKGRKVNRGVARGRLGLRNTNPGARRGRRPAQRGGFESRTFQTSPETYLAVRPER